MKEHTWNYRVIKTTNKIGDWYGIYEVFYENNKHDSCTKEPISIISEDSVEDLKEVYKMIKEAFEQPVLDMKIFDGF